MGVNPLSIARDLIIEKFDASDQRKMARRQQDVRNLVNGDEIRMLERCLEKTNEHLIDAISSRDAYKALNEAILHELSSGAEPRLAIPSAVEQRKKFLDNSKKRLKKELLETLNP